MGVAPQSGSGHVAVVSSNFSPEPTGISQTVGEFAGYLGARGVDVRVVAAMPFYPQWKIWSQYRGAWWRTERRDQVTIYRSWHYVAPKPSTVTRLLHEATLSAFAFPNLLRALFRARKVYIVTPPLTLAFLASVVAAVLRRPSVLVVKDIMPEAAIELGMLRNRFLIGLSRALARGAYRLADEIHTLSDGMRLRIVAAGALESKIRIVPDTVDAEELAPVPSPANEFRRRFVADGAFTVLHTGNMGKKQDLQLLLRAAERLRHDPGVRFLVFGDGAAKEDFLDALAARGLENVTHHPLQSRAMLPHMLSGADVVLVSQLPEVVDIVLPSKLLTSLAAGAMIVTACDARSETAKLVRASGGGLVIPAGEDAALVEVIARIRAGTVDVAGCRARARAFAKHHFGRDAVYGTIARELGAEVLLSAS